ncbi:hypothetical protein F0A16_04065 [Salinicola corii]|uniref:Uncharacterized protein n=1 Tax=Salinicola corii TaxID=2606937 RepID=A0A640WGP0_9GAMM|nr:hypothetical protein [Salinicola corii]KAA0019527.1 hypothetical protein F0A16_04065 [Salinicola corii]
MTSLATATVSMAGRRFRKSSSTFSGSRGKLVEHWDVLQNEVPVTASLGDIAMFAPEKSAPQTRPEAK